MKKKLLLIITMFLVIFNVKALTFNVDVTNIEYTGNNGTIGSVESIDLEDRKINAFFQDIGDEVSFKVTITNSGDRAGTLRSIDFESTGNSIEYTTDLPAEGLSINGNDTNFVNITARVKEGAVNGNTSSEIKLTYKYDEGSCPEGEILSDDESMCLCPEGKERNETGICVKPETPVECADDEIYNSEKKICEKKEVTPPTPVDPDEPDTKPVEPDTKPVEPEKPIPKVVPNNPKTLDNIVLITLLFIVSGLGIYAAMYKKLNTNKKKITVGAITGTITLTLSFTVLASVFGIDNLLGAIVNPITKTKQLVIKVNERIDLIETWDGECSVETSELTPENIFEGGTGTEDDPYQIKNAEQLSCFAASVNQGNTYEGKFVKQIKNIKLNDHLNDQATANDLSNAHMWIPIGYDQYRSFNGTYDGDNHIISGLYIDYADPIYYSINYVGLFGRIENSSIQNLSLSDVYMAFSDSDNYFLEKVGALVSKTSGNLTLKNIKTSGNIINSALNFDGNISGVVSEVNASNNGILVFENIENNINITSKHGYGIISYLSSYNSNTDDYIITMKNLVNNGNFNVETGAGVVGSIALDYSMYNSSEYDNHFFVLLDGLVNTGNATLSPVDPDDYYINLDFDGILGGANKTIIRNSHNTGNFSTHMGAQMNGIFGSGTDVVIENCYNSGNLILDIVDPEGGVAYDDSLNFASSSAAGIADYCYNCEISNSYNTGEIMGALGNVGGLIQNGMFKISNSYNLGDLYGSNFMGGIAADSYTGSIVENSYNKGNIIAWFEDPYYEYYLTFIGGIVGGETDYFDDVTINNCYNEGDISVLAKVADQNSKIAGIVPYGAVSVKNSYNRGNLYSKYSRVGMCGVACDSTEIVNSYNSGNMTFENYEGNEVEPWWDSPIYFGIGDYSDITNSYNLGNIFLNDDTGAYGIGGYGSSNSVNTGNITFNINVPFTSTRNIVLYGGAQNGVNDNNLYNSGILSIIDRTNEHTVRDSNLNNSVSIGVISETNYGNESENFYSEWVSIVCHLSNACTLQDSDEIGSYPSIDVPDILSIINTEGAYNDELDEDGLPTLKVFNN